MTGWIVAAGLGPGADALVTPEVSDALAQATDVIGYIPYVARVAQRPGLMLHASDNRVELERAAHALTLAALDQITEQCARDVCRHGLGRHPQQHLPE